MFRPAGHKKKMWRLERNMKGITLVLLYFYVKGMTAHPLYESPAAPGV